MRFTLDVEKGAGGMYQCNEKLTQRNARYERTPKWAWIDGLRLRLRVLMTLNPTPATLNS